MENNLSKTLTKQLDSNVKRDEGIYFTPTKDVQLLVDKLLKITKGFKTVLEPSCGSCEFVRYIDSMLSGLKIDGYETNSEIYKKIKQLRFRNRVTLYNRDFLQTSLSKKYDLIIGNPPFFETDQYRANEFFRAKVNIYLLFVIHSLKKLNRGGYLLFVLPSNFLTNMYCDNLRRHLFKFYQICMVHIFEGSGYIDTAQETCAVLFRRIEPPKVSPFALVLPDRVIFNGRKEAARMRALLSQGTTLEALGFKVGVGSVLWNENKELLTNDSKCTRLIYSTDIVDNKLSKVSYSNPAKRNYIRRDGTDESVIVVNRGYGSSRYAFRFAMIGERNYLVENHLLVIRHSTLTNRSAIKKKLLKVYESFTDPRTEEFVALYFKNNAMSTMELHRILPIFQ
jgi:tRNA1(Val) A37 N6-methylase TrmN6